MIIKAMRWADVPEGSIVLCQDGVQREIGERRPSTTSGVCRRTLGKTALKVPGNSVVERPADAMTLIVESTDDQRAAGHDTTDVIMMFMRAGFQVEVLHA